ncbi:MAG: bifunctional FO biosynthesis protein CofGH, partial [Actinobacteria bacterium]|nr:bifunctional FO biosynthesis protein CofGH [Actinomycetota bacterium]
MDPYALTGTPLEELLARAQALRAERRDSVVTYSPKVFIPLAKLCRDVCHYCTFAQPPRRGERAYMTDEEVLAVARAGADAGCHEALFTLGDKPELRYRIAREELAELGCETTVEYLARMCELVLEETGLLPHANPGVMTRAELSLLRGVTASQGIMLETVSERLSQRGGAHFGSPDKVPARRLETIGTAGELAIPFTTGILIGIGETRAERIDALLAVRALHERYGHVQEFIVQNFRAKPGTKMASHPEPPLEDLLWTAAVSRIVLGPDVNIQTPPNLSYDEFPRLLDAGINDWGGVSPVTIDHVNPEAPWPEVERLAAATRARGLELVPRLPIYPEYVHDLDRWTEPRVAAAIRARADGTGHAREDGWAAGASGPPSDSMQFAEPSWGTPAHHPLSSVAGNSAHVGNGMRLNGGGPVKEVLAKFRAEIELDEADVTTLFQARGDDFRAVTAAADALRRDVCGDTVTYVVTRNINYTNVCYFRCGFCAFSKGKLAANLRGAPYLVPLDEIVRRCREAWDRGAVEVCLQGGIHPGFTGDYYAEVCETIKSELPDLHVHAFSALEVWQGAATLGLQLADYLERLRDLGLASLPGTAAEILDDGVRRILCPDKVTTAQWLEVHDAAHRVGLRSTTTIMFGSVEGPRSWARHLIHLREQQKKSGGFTEFVPLPFVHMEAPIFLKGKARQGPTFREALLMHAVGRLALHPAITNIQASWVKLGVAGAQAALRAGANDLGGTLMNESISRAAGAAHGQEMPPER